VAISAASRNARRPSRYLNAPGLAFLLGLSVLWEFLVRTGLLEFQFLPAPLGVVQGLWELLASGQLIEALAHTAIVTLLGWCLASMFGVSIGVLLGLSDRSWRWSAASIEVLRSFPSIAFLPVAVLLLGFSYRMELLLVVYGAVWPVLVNTMDGVHNVKPELRDVAQTYRMSRLHRLRAVVLPAAASKILVGLRLSLALSLILAVAAEVVGNPRGLGYGLVFEQQALQPERMFAYFIVIGLFGVMVNALFQFTARRTMPGVVAATEDRRAA
jgi:ABC-type nitrate/sulfonate/bicarbonate transport system permease component